jgi:hypothetical protein
MCPFDLATDQNGWTYNEHLTLNAIDYIERAVSERLKTNIRDTFEPILETSDIEINVSEYKPILTTNLLGWQITLAENKEKPEPFLVEQRREPDLGIKNDIYYCGITSDYLEAMTEFSNRLQYCVGVANSNRELNKNQHGINYTELKSSDCLPDSGSADFTGKLIIIKAGELKPEYRTADHQLILCSHGNGARPNAKGTSVFGKELLSGDTVCYGRHQIEGVADENNLPQWAKSRLAVHQKAKSNVNNEVNDKITKKPTLTEKLSSAKEKAARQAATKEQQTEIPKKRKDMEVR